MSRNFTNGSLVLRVWRFDGGSELLGKFQYFSDAKMFAAAKMASEADRTKDYFFLAVCDYECEAVAFGSIPPSPTGEA